MAEIACVTDPVTLFRDLLLVTGQSTTCICDSLTVQDNPKHYEQNEFNIQVS